MIGTLASDSSIWSRRKLRWSFQAFPSSTYDHQGFLEIIKAKGQGLKKLAIVFEETPFSVGAKDWAVKAAQGQGLTVDAYGYTPGAQDFRSIIERMVGFGAEAVSMGGYYEPSIALTRQMIERGFNPAGYNFIQAADGVSKNALGANIEGIFGRSAWEATEDNAPTRAFVAAYEARYKRTPSYHSAAALRRRSADGRRDQGRRHRPSQDPRLPRHPELSHRHGHLQGERARPAGGLPLRRDPVAGRGVEDRRW